jgi:hypothetical protein
MSGAGFFESQIPTMKLTEDLKSARAIHAKGVLFVVLGLLSGALLFAQAPTWRTVLLIAITVWAFCRFYYYLFYVLERYLGREKKFAGVLDALGYLLSRRRESENSTVNLREREREQDRE